jgi:cytochrome c-type biogenesis protein CcmF
MDSYYLTYLGDTVAEPNHYYNIQFQKREKDTGRVTEQFILKPNAQINPKMGLVSSPDTRHYLTHDIFTYITSTVDKSKNKDTTSYQSKNVKVGDSIYFSNGYILFKGFETSVTNKNYTAQTGDIAVAANLEVHDLTGKTLSSKPIYVIRNQDEVLIEDTIKEYNLYTRLSKIHPDDGTAVVEIKQPSAMNDYVIMKAILFPYINVLWIGTVIMIIGFGISLLKRYSINK